MEPDGMDLWKMIFLYNQVGLGFHVGLFQDTKGSCRCAGAPCAGAEPQSLGRNDLQQVPVLPMKYVPLGSLVRLRRLPDFQSL